MSTYHSIGDPSVFGAVLTSTGTGTSPTWVIPTDEANIAKINKRLDAIEERLLIINPNESMHEKYPALKEAYEAYKIVEKLVK